MATSSAPKQGQSRFLIKANADAIRRNLNRRRVAYPVWVIVNGQNYEQARFVYGIRGSDFQSQVNVDAPLPDGFGHSIAYFLTTNEVDVQLELDGEFRSLSSLLEDGTIQWTGWTEEYHRVGLDGCS